MLEWQLCEQRSRSQLEENKTDLLMTFPFKTLTLVFRRKGQKKNCFLRYLT